MLRKFALLVLLMSLAIPLGGVAQAQEAPIYVRYCDAARQTNGEAPLRTVLDNVETQLQTVEAFLESFESGTLTYIEGIALAEDALNNWDESSKIDCLAALNSDVQRALSEVLISMLYGQLVEGDRSQSHLDTARTLIATIRERSDAARTYLEQPLQTADASAPPSTTADTETDTEAESTDTTAEQPATTDADTDGGLRTQQELTNLLTDYLTNNGVTVLIDAAVQPNPDNTLIVVRLNRFEANGQIFDLENSLFTMDIIADAIADWPEQADLTRVVVETYDGTSRVLFAEASGENFLAHYYENTLPRDQFIDSLTLEPAPEESAPAEGDEG